MYTIKGTNKITSPPPPPSESRLMTSRCYYLKEKKIHFYLSFFLPSFVEQRSRFEFRNDGENNPLIVRQLEVLACTFNKE